VIAARVAAQLSNDSLLRDAGVRVERLRGHVGELRVTVDGRDVVDSHWYPTPSAIVERVRAALRDAP
jgi:hypothetical protein